jgi:hypothetical protein
MDVNKDSKAFFHIQILEKFVVLFLKKIIIAKNKISNSIY